MVNLEPLTLAELINSFIRVAGLSLVAWGINEMRNSNIDRKANAEVLRANAEVLQGVARTLNAHTDALERLLGKRE